MNAQVVSIDLQTLIELVSASAAGLAFLIGLYVSARVRTAKLEFKVDILKKDVCGLGGKSRHYMED